MSLRHLNMTTVVRIRGVPSASRDYHKIMKSDVDSENSTVATEEISVLRTRRNEEHTGYV